MHYVSPITFLRVFSFFFFFNDTATTEIYTLSLHDALPIFAALHVNGDTLGIGLRIAQERLLDFLLQVAGQQTRLRSEEHTSELQSQSNLVCRLLLEKKIYLTANHKYVTAMESHVVPTLVSR